MSQDTPTRSRNLKDRLEGILKTSYYYSPVMTLMMPAYNVARLSFMYLGRLYVENYFFPWVPTLQQYQKSLRMQRSTITQTSNNIVRTAQGMDGMDVLLREISRINETLDVYYSMALNSTSDERSTHFWEKLWNKYMSTDWIVEQATTSIAAIIMLVGVCYLYSIRFRKALRREQRYPYEDCQVIAWSLFGIGTGLYLSAEDDIMNHGIRPWLGTIGVLLSLVGYVFLRRRREARIIRYGSIVLDFEYHIFTIDGKPLTLEHSEVLIELLRAILRTDARRREIGRKIRYNRCLIRINKRRIQELKKRKAQRRIKPTME